MHSILLLLFVARCLETIDVCIWHMFDFMSVVVTVWGSGFSVRLLCFVQAKTLYRYSCMYFFSALVLVCVDVIVMSSVLDMT